MSPLFFLQSRKYSCWIYSCEKYTELSKTPTLGKRSRIPFVTFDVYYCEGEPQIIPVRGLHVITWHLPKTTDTHEQIKKGGWLGPFGKHFSSACPAAYLDVSDPKYYKNWSKRKREYRQTWINSIENNELNVQECTIDTFKKNYVISDLPKRVIRFNQAQIKNLYRIYDKDMKFFIIKNVELNKIVGGTCLLLDYDLQQVVNQYNFSDKNYPAIGVGIMDLCAQQARKLHFKYISLTVLKTPSVTKFKMLFNPIVLYFRHVYIKITYNK